MEYINYVTSGLRVLIDRTADFVKYYAYSDNDIDDTDNNKKNIKKRIFEPKSKIEQIQTFFSEPTYIIDNIYLGSAFNASNYNSLKQNNIGLIINMTNEISNYYNDEIIYKKYGLYDNNNEPIIQYLEKTFEDIIEFQKKYPNKNILIHCFMGASRSASILTYYIHKKFNISIDESIIFIKNKREIINLTTLFYNQLLEIEKNK
jgi:protein-tyrosine phosphatase